MPTVARTIPPPTAGQGPGDALGESSVSNQNQGREPATASSNNAGILIGTLEKLSTTSIAGEPTLEVSRGILTQGKLRSKVMPFGPKYAASASWNVFGMDLLSAGDVHAIRDLRGNSCSTAAESR